MGDLDSIPRLGRSPEVGSGYPLQYSGLENSMDCIILGRKELDMNDICPHGSTYPINAVAITANNRITPMFHVSRKVYDP